MQKISNPKKDVSLDFASLMQDIVNFQPQSLFEVAARREAESSIAYTVDKAREIVTTGTQKDKRLLSNYVFKLSGIYRRAVITGATMATFDSEVIPLPLTIEGYDSESFEREFGEVLNYLHNSDFKQDLTRVMFYLFKDGRYYGLVREKESPAGEEVNGVFIQDLPIEYCRVRNKDMLNRWIIEFDLSYFDNLKVITGEDRNLMKKVVLEAMPEEIQKAYAAYKNQKIQKWISLNTNQTFCVTSFDGDPLLMSSIPDIIALTEMKDVNKEIDALALKKLLVSQLPITKDGELVFDIEESKEIHKTMAQILANSKHIDLLTTFGNTEALNLEPKDGIHGDKLIKSERSVYNEMGISSSLYNSDGNAAVGFSIDNLSSMVFSFFSEFERIIGLFITQMIDSSKTTFAYRIMRVTEFNKNKMLGNLLNQASYGYPVKTNVMIAQGYSQLEIMGKAYLENQFLKMHENMIPTQSSHTLSGDDDESKSGPKEKPIEEVSTKTIKNKNAGGK